MDMTRRLFKQVVRHAEWATFGLVGHRVFSPGVASFTSAVAFWNILFHALKFDEQQRSADSPDEV